MKKYIVILFIAFMLNGWGQSASPASAKKISWVAAFDSAEPDRAELMEIIERENRTKERAASLIKNMQILDSLLAKKDYPMIDSLSNLRILDKVKGILYQDTTLVEISLLLEDDSDYDESLNFEANLSRYPALLANGQKLEIHTESINKSQVEPFYIKDIGKVDLSIKNFKFHVTDPSNTKPYSTFLMSLIDEIYMVFGSRITIPKQEYLTMETKRNITDEFNKCVNRRKFVLFLKDTFKL